MFLPNPRGGKALRESTGQRDDVAAHQVYLERVRRPLDTGPTKKQRSLNDALQIRLEWLRTNRKNNDPSRKKLAEETIEFYEKKSGVLVRILGPDLLLSEITPETIRDYITARTNEGVKGTAISKELTALSMAVKLAYKDEVECRLIRDLKPEDFISKYVPRKRWLTRAEVKAVMAELSPPRAALVALIVSTGATYPSEALRLRKEDVDVKRFTIHIRGTKREQRDRMFTIPSDRRDLFKQAVAFVPFENWTNIRRAFNVVAAKLEIPEFCPTDLRRTFAQWLMQAGVPYELAYPLMGHADDRMLKLVYGKRTAVDVGPLLEAAMKNAKPRRRASRSR